MSADRVNKLTRLRVQLKRLITEIENLNHQLVETTGTGVVKGKEEMEDVLKRVEEQIKDMSGI